MFTVEYKISMNVSNANLMLSHAVPSIGEWTFLFVIQRLVNSLSINLWELKETYESSELGIKNRHRI